MGGEGGGGVPETDRHAASCPSETATKEKVVFPPVRVTNRPLACISHLHLLPRALPALPQVPAQTAHSEMRGNCQKQATAHGKNTFRTKNTSLVKTKGSRLKDSAVALTQVPIVGGALWPGQGGCLRLALLVHLLVDLP